MPTVNICNPSSQRQVRWVVCPMPLSQANALPAACVVNGRYPAFKADVLGVTTQLWHVKVDIAGNGDLSLTDWKPRTGPLPTFELSPWVADTPARDVLRLGIYEDGTWRRNIELKAGTKISESPVSQTWEFRGSNGGYHFVAWATFWTGQDVVDIRGSAMWSDPTVPEWFKPNVKLMLESGAWPVLGERIALYLAKPNGFAQTNADGWAWKLYQGKLPHGVGIAFRGCICPVDDLPLPITLSEQQAHAIDAQRIANCNAAAEAPLVAACDWTQSPQDWMAFGVVPTTTRRSDKVRVLAETSVPGSYFDVRPFANGANHGGTGDQPPFGALKDLIALQGDPWRVYHLLDSSLDYWRRGFHHRELDGRRTTKAIRPGMQTWQGTIEPKMSPDTFGKPNTDAPYGWDQVGQRSIFADDQHRGDAYILCVYALTGDPLLLECIRDVLAVDEMRAMPAREWFDAPRATGRLMQSWAKVACITSGYDRDLAILLAREEALDRGTDQDAWNYNPVTCVEWKSPDPRVLPHDNFCVPWNDSLCVLGLLEAAHAIARIGRDGSVPIYMLAGDIARSIVRYATVTDSRDGTILPINGLKWLPGGEANPPAYYTFPRHGAAQDTAPDIDMLVGTRGWWTWYAGSLSAAMDSSDAEVKAKATAIWNANATGTQTIGAMEWWAVR